MAIADKPSILEPEDRKGILGHYKYLGLAMTNDRTHELVIIDRIAKGRAGISKLNLIL